MKNKLHIFGASGRLGRSISNLAASEFSLVVPDEAEIFIDATLPPAVPEHIALALAKKKPIVIGVTGLPEETQKLMREAAQQIAVFYAPNFSLGIALLRRCAKLVSEAFPSDIDLIETHHTQKKDIPSGTALAIAAEIGRKTNIHSIRSGQIVGKHELIFNSAEEQISIVHTSHSRDVFARGALAAARFILDAPPSLYGMDDLIAKKFSAEYAL